MEGGLLSWTCTAAEHSSRAVAALPASLKTGPPHLGHMFADVDDEHGVPQAVKALEEGLAIREVVLHLPHKCGKKDEHGQSGHGVPLPLSPGGGRPCHPRDCPAPAL